MVSRASVVQACLYIPSCTTKELHVMTLDNDVT